MKQNVPSDIPIESQYIPAESLKSNDWLKAINEWTLEHKMMINEKKCKTMIFNYTDNHQFTTRLNINDAPIEVIDSTRLLGTIISSDLKWDLNTANIVKKANARMELLRKVASFGTNPEDLKTIYIVFIRSLLEQSATVWHSSLTEENKSDLERVQQTALKVILGDSYINYETALRKLDMENLDSRRRNLCLRFAIKASRNPKCREMFPVNDTNHTMNTRKHDKFKVQHANTARLKKFSIIYMQNLLNEETR